MHLGSVLFLAPRFVSQAFACHHLRTLSWSVVFEKVIKCERRVLCSFTFIPASQGFQRILIVLDKLWVATTRKKMKSFTLNFPCSRCPLGQDPSVSLGCPSGPGQPEWKLLF